MNDLSGDFYAQLNLTMDATPEEIRRAYRQLVRQHHPDTQSEQGTAMLFRQIQTAYETLSDPNRRAAYDRLQIEAGHSPKAPFNWNFQFSRSVLPTIGGEQVVYLLFEITAGQSAKAIEQLPLNLALLIDRSTSMQGTRLDQTKAAAQHLIDSLTSHDTLSIIAFSDRAEVIWPSQPMTDPIRAKAKVSAIQTSGGTEILQGLTTALIELDKRRRDRSINHLIMLTDGQTYGDEEKCLALAVEAKKRRIGISALGIGADWNDTLLDAIAARSGGTSQYAAATDEIQSLLHERLRGLGAIYGDNLRLTVKTNGSTRLQNAFILLPYIQHCVPENDNLLLGTLEMDKSVSGLLEFSLGPYPAGQHRVAQLELNADIPAQNRIGERLKRDLTFTFSTEAELASAAPATILSALAKVTIYRMQEGAWQALAQGDIASATHRLEAMATRLLDLNEPQLARAALLEAGRLSRVGNTSSIGRKTIKYGTRSLFTPPVKDKEND
jgi:Ca-activated chloride channel family protein